MMMESASAIKREVLHLIDLQIETLKQESSLESTQISEYRARSERIRKLYEALDGLALTQFLSGRD